MDNAEQGQQGVQSLQKAKHNERDVKARTRLSNKETDKATCKAVKVERGRWSSKFGRSSQTIYQSLARGGWKERLVSSGLVSGADCTTAAKAKTKR